jgi:1-phosphofructokinase family hexose kinase
VSETPPILCVGTTPTLQRTIVFDTVDAGEANRATETHDFAGGKATNVARVLHSLGRPAILLAPVGGNRGWAMTDDLDRAGIRHDLVEIKTQTRLCVTVVDRSRRQATELVEEAGPLTEVEVEAFLRRLEVNLANGAAAVVLSGSLAAHVGEDFYAEAVRRAKAAGVPCVVDARGAALWAAVAAGPDVAKPNRRELAQTVGRSVDSRRTLRAAMAQVVAAGAGWVVCTRGRDGSSVSGGSTTGDEPRYWEVTTPHVEHISPIGCGDAYAAGLALALADGLPLPEACRPASALGAANSATLHAGHIDASSVPDLLDNVRVREVA